MPTATQLARRQRIIDAALELLEEREYEKIQIRDIAEAAGVALGTLYRYFPSKDRLFANALVEWSSSFETTVRRRAGDKSPPERLALLLHRAAAAFERYPHYFQLITVLEVVDDPAVRAPFLEYGGRIRGVVMEALDGIDPEDAEMIAALVLPLLAAELRYWSVGARSMREVRKRLDHAVELIFRTPRSS
jgi:AcrR family transcriptional regulator